MSYDLEIYSHLEPIVAELRGVLGADEWCEAASWNDSTIALIRGRVDSGKQLGTLDGPFAVEGDDIPEAISPWSWRLGGYSSFMSSTPRWQSPQSGGSRRGWPIASKESSTTSNWTK